MRLKTIQITAALLIIIISAGIMSPALAVDWYPDTPLPPAANPESWDNAPHVFQDVDGRIWVVWSSDREGRTHDDLFYSTSVDGGSSWTFPPANITDDPNSDVNPSALQAADGSIWVVWTSYRTGNYDIFFKTSVDGGYSWSSFANITDYPGWDSDPSITQLADGTICVAWVREVEGNYDIFFKTSVDGGFSWSSETQVSTSPSWDLAPYVFQDVDGRIWVVWSSYRTGNYDLFYKTSVNGGLSWTSHPPLTTDTDFDITPSITQDVNGRIWVVWSSDRQGTSNLYFKTSEDYGLSWSPDDVLASSNQDDLNPSITNTNERKIWAVWSSARTGDFEIFYKISYVIAIHDVAITDVAPFTNTVGKDEPLYVTVVAENQGTVDETIEVRCYANTTLIGSQTITAASGASLMLTLSCDTSSLTTGIYIISANASAVPSETTTNIDDNTFINGPVRAWITGDLDLDGKVNIADKGIMSINWGDSFTPENPNYDPYADLNGDSAVDILDKWILNANWGLSW